MWNQLRAAGDTEQAKALNGTRWALLKTPRNQSGDQRTTMASIATINKPLYRLPGQRQLRMAFEAKGEQGRALLAGWLAWARRSRLPEFVRLAETIKTAPAVDPQHPRPRAEQRAVRGHQHPPAAADPPRLRLPQPRRAHRHSHPHPRWTLPTTPRTIMRTDPREQQRSEGTIGRAVQDLLPFRGRRPPLTFTEGAPCSTAAPRWPSADAGTATSSKLNQAGLSASFTQTEGMCSAIAVLLGSGYTLLVTDAEGSLAWDSEHRGWGVGLYPSDQADSAGDCLAFDSTADSTAAALPPLVHVYVHELLIAYTYCCRRGAEFARACQEWASAQRSDRSAGRPGLPRRIARTTAAAVSGLCPLSRRTPIGSAFRTTVRVRCGVRSAPAFRPGPPAVDLVARSPARLRPWPWRWQAAVHVGEDGGPDTYLLTWLVPAPGRRIQAVVATRAGTGGFSQSGQG